MKIYIRTNNNGVVGLDISSEIADAVVSSVLYETSSCYSSDLGVNVVYSTDLPIEVYPNLKLNTHNGVVFYDDEIKTIGVPLVTNGAFEVNPITLMSSIVFYIDNKPHRTAFFDIRKTPMIRTKWAVAKVEDDVKSFFQNQNERG